MIRVVWINVLVLLVCFAVLEGGVRAVEYVKRRPALKQTFGADSQPSYFVPDDAVGYRGPSRGGRYRS